MENFIFGVQSFALSIRMTLVALLYHPLMWGFGLGFFASTVIHLIIVTDVPHAIPLMVTRGPLESFQKIASRDDAGSYNQSYTAFQKEHNRVRIAFYLALSTFLMIILFSLLRGV